MSNDNETRNTRKPRLASSTPPRPADIDRIPEPDLPSTGTKIMNKLVIAALVVVAISLGVFFKWAAADENVLTVNNEPFPTRTIREHPTAGGVVLLDVDVCKNSDVAGKTRISFVSKTREVLLPETDEELNKGCLKREIPILIPNDLPADTYKIRFRVTYNLNPLKQGVVDEFESKEFTIEPVTQ